ncbi:hypothetical protein M3Y98_00245700 [Aphelenchoides besseyi]|nr:hypothetical protein M3Y98_00245700 [Aphelenchoides besseyi]KAI6200718.1 hypothetical protein M3Y96_00763800 [Aphelenchoides besseyi]
MRFLSQLLVLVAIIFISLASPPIKPWHCENDYIRHLVISGLKDYSNSMDQLQRYLQNYLQPIFTTDPGEWLVSVSRVVRGIDDVADSVAESQSYCMVAYENETVTITVLVVRIDNKF